MSEEHYRALGISPDASKAEIRAAYKQRVKETHPDLNDDPNAADEFQRVKAARDALLGSDATGGAGAGSTRSGPGSAGSGGTSGTDGTGTSSSGRSADRGSSAGDRTGTSGGGADSRERRDDATSDSDPRANYNTRTEEPSGDHANEYRGTSGSSGRTAGGSSTGTGSGDRSRTDRSETTAGSGSRQQGTRGTAGGRTSGGSTDRRREAGAGAGGAQDYVRFRSVIEEPTGNRAVSYDRVVTGTHSPARQGATGTGTGTGTRRGTGTTSETGGVSDLPMLVPAFLVVLVKQYIYSLKWALLGLPLTFIYLMGIRGLYFGGLHPSSLSYVLGAVGVSLVKARLGVNFSGTATIALAYYVFVWYPSQAYGPLSWLEVGLAVHLLPLFVVTALITEYK